MMPGKQLYGDYRGWQVQPFHDGQPYPAVSGEMGYVVAGQPIGLKMSTEKPVPTVTLTISNPVVKYPSSMVDPNKTTDSLTTMEPTTGVDMYQPSDDPSNAAGHAAAGAKGPAFGRKLLSKRGGARKLLQPSLGGGYWSLGDPKSGDYQGIAFDIYAGQGDAVKGNAAMPIETWWSLQVGIATGVANNTNGVTTNGYYTDTYISDRGTQDLPIAGEVGVVKNGWTFGMKQLPGENKTNLVFDITRPVLPYNGKPVPTAQRYGPDPAGGSSTSNSTDTSSGSGSNTPENNPDASGDTDKSSTASGSKTGNDEDEDTDSVADTAQSGDSSQKGN